MQSSMNVREMLFFSGGVDSGLLAARLARLGRTDVTLAAYSFSPRDSETRLATAMADHLGFSCLTVAHDPRSLEQVLAQAMQAALVRGPLSGYPLQGLHVTLSGIEGIPVTFASVVMGMPIDPNATGAVLARRQMPAA